MKTLAELQKDYSEFHFVEVTDREQAISDINSRSSCCWGAGQKIDGGWIQLASPSKRSKEDKRTVFVCKADLIK
jgi:hypothetical protein